MIFLLNFLQKNFNFQINFFTEMIKQQLINYKYINDDSAYICSIYKI